jgi:HlyD family secretion protein
MTANLRVQIANRHDVLRVPNAALRFRPTTDIFAALKQPVPPDMPFGGRGGRGRQNGQMPADADIPRSGGSTAQPSGASADQGRARMLERFTQMSPAQRNDFIARMKERGVDVTPFQQAAAAGKTSPGGKPQALPSADTIDALFAPLPTVESRGRVWLYENKQLKAITLRLGITDGTSSELLSGDLAEGAALVTGVITGSARTSSASGTGNPLLPNPQRGGFGQPGGFGGGRGR